MTSIESHQSLIAFELINDDHPEVTVIEFLAGDILGPVQALELADQLDCLILSGAPRNVVIDFRNARTLGSSAFGVIARFVREVSARPSLQSRRQLAPWGRPSSAWMTGSNSPTAAKQPFAGPSRTQRKAARRLRTIPS